MGSKEKLMNATKFTAAAFLIFALIVAFGAPWRMQAQDDKTPYPIMAPLGQYLMERNAEIAVARSAAPAAISNDATVLVFGPKGYETAATGKNGFVCLVERSWTSLPTTIRSFGTPRDAFLCATMRAPHAF
jgi:hypothetical protein